MANEQQPIDYTPNPDWLNELPHLRNEIDNATRICSPDKPYYTNRIIRREEYRVPSIPPRHWTEECISGPFAVYADAVASAKAEWAQMDNSTRRIAGIDICRLNYGVGPGRYGPAEPKTLFCPERISPMPGDDGQWLNHAIKRMYRLPRYLIGLIRDGEILLCAKPGCPKGAIIYPSGDMLIDTWGEKYRSYDNMVIPNNIDDIVLSTFSGRIKRLVVTDEGTTRDLDELGAAGWNIKIDNLGIAERKTMDEFKSSATKWKYKRFTPGYDGCERCSDCIIILVYPCPNYEGPAWR